MSQTYNFNTQLNPYNPYDRNLTASPETVSGSITLDGTKFVSAHVKVNDGANTFIYTDGQSGIISKYLIGVYVGSVGFLMPFNLYTGVVYNNFSQITDYRDGASFVAFDVAACFCAGARIATPDGERAVETLRIGDRVLTANGGVEPLVWIGRRRVHTRFADPLRLWPVRIAAGALGENLPAQDLLLSPDHALFLDGLLVHAGALVNGRTIVQHRPEGESFSYYHLEIDTHALIRANGALAETFVDNADRMAFDNWTEHETLYPGGRSVPELPYPRAKSARQVPRALRQRLAARAEALARQAA